VYEYMHKLRQVVDCVTEDTAEVVEAWFRTDNAAVPGMAHWDAVQVKNTIVASGGGCHRLGWLGSGPWSVKRVSVGADGLCQGCGCHLARIDIDAGETQRFADSVASLALERETKSNFSQFQVCDS
jgi:proteinaceous RNase P